jgi:hypothetical protein
MSVGKVAVTVCSLGGLFCAGWQFLDRSLYRDSEEKDRVVQVFTPAVTPLLLQDAHAYAKKKATLHWFLVQGWLVKNYSVPCAYEVGPFFRRSSSPSSSRSPSTCCSWCSLRSLAC